MPRSSPVLVSAAFAALCGLAAPAAAQPVWIGPGTDFNTATNWSTGTLPGVGGFIFQNTGPTSLSTSTSSNFRGILYDVGAPTYTITATGVTTLEGNVVNNSGVEQVIIIPNGQAMSVQGTSATGTNVTYQIDGGMVLRNSSVGGESNFIVNGQMVIQGAARTITMGALSGGANVSLDTTSDVRLVIGGLNTVETYSGVLRQNQTGLMTLEKVGTGVLTLTGTNTYTGGTTITAGTLQIGNGGAGGRLGTGAVVNDAALVFNTTSAQSVADVISGTGTLRQNGSGVLTLGGANTYSGGTTITTGTIALNDLGGLGTGGVSLDGGTLRGNVTGTLANDIAVATAGLGTISAATGQTVTLTGQFSLGDDAVIVFGSLANTGTLIAQFSGISTTNPPGSLRIAGGTLVSGNRSIAQLSERITTTTIDAGATLDLDGNTPSSSFAINDLRGAGRLTNTGVTYVRAGDFSGEIAGTAQLEKIGADTLILTGANSYTGGTTITAGTLQVGNGGTTGALGTGAVVNDAALAFNRGNAVTFGEVISGTGTLTQNGSSVLTLTGANTYSGDTTIAAGTLRVGNGGTTGTLGSGAVVNNAALAFDRSDAVTVGNLISGTGTLAQNGSGVLTLTGANTYSGGTALRAGTIEIANGGALGTGTLTFDGGALRATGTDTLANAIALNTGASASITAAAGETLTLTGAQSLPGVNTLVFGSATDTGIIRYRPTSVNFASMTELRVAGGTLRIGNAMPGANSTIIEAGATLDFSERSSTTEQITNLQGAGDLINPNTTLLVSGNFAGRIMGSGDIDKIGMGTLILTGANSYSGGTTIQTGTVQVGDGGTSGTLGSGAVVNNGALVFNRSDAVTVGNLISGSGTLTQDGPGNLILNAANTYTGATTVQAGRLSVNGSIAASSGVTVEAGGTLGGTGSLPGVAVRAGGAIAPGNSIGTLTVSGDLALAPGSTTQIEVQGPLADRINVSGTATLGGTLQLVALGGSYSFNAPYTLIQAGAVAGSFAALDTQGSFGAGVTSTVNTTATEAQLLLTPAMLVPIITDPPPPATPGVPVPILGQGTPNQIAVAAGLDRAVTDGADVSAFFPLYNLPAAQLPRGLDQVSGQVHAVAAGLHAQGAGQFLGAILDPARDAEAPGDGAAGSTPRYAVWATALAANQRMEAGGNATNSVSSTSGGVAAGADVRLSAQVVAGFALAATGATARLSDGLGRAEGTQLQGAVHGTGQFGPLRLAAALAYGAMELSTERSVPFLGAGDLRSDVTSQGVSTRLEAGWRVADVLPGVALTPALAFQGSWYTVPSYTERATGGQGAAALAVAGQTQGQSRLEMTVRADTSLGPALSGFARAGWAAYLQRDAGMSAQFIGLPQAGFTVSGPRPDAHAALVSGGLDWRLSPSTTVTARVDAELSGNSHAVNGTARIRYAF
ncbi:MULTISPECIES: autotransporter-associated beta strand repeat-containing protein [Roseomonadaceae]|uniref:Autotransporter-associated beta strand repeat-containing protein n=1 Tax=Falsiroseomonas oleicola TaxID=2801474 RepID=A0ABS6HH63_9PROT|nr:autotransporter outer membrane beta-barrel domain-containing protein [Roseomonas oleicola]MBU8546821.1 autotransporter-associated beta strand repeat-containing protein [Roseomonas oleicola]